MTAALDLDSYFKLLGYFGDRSPTLENLRRIHSHHTDRLPYVTVNRLVVWPVRLDVHSLQQKLVYDGRGGYCYEQNLLFRNVLEAIGFKVTGLAARVRWNVPEGAVLPRTHMLLHIVLDGHAYIADVGFGSLTLTLPLRLELNIEQSTPHELFRLISEDAEFVLQARLGEAWKSLYGFTLQEQLLADYEMANWYVSCHPKSRFVNGLIAARAARDKRYALLNNQFAVHYPEGKTERRVLSTAAE